MFDPRLVYAVGWEQVVLRFGLISSAAVVVFLQVWITVHLVHALDRSGHKAA